MFVVESSCSSLKHRNLLRCLLLDLPLWGTLFVASTAYALKVFYHGPMQSLIESYRRSGKIDKEGYYPDFFPDVTYYARQCDQDDVTTHDSNDIVLPYNSTASQAAHVMMTHGAVLLKDILTPQTAQQLRDYLETRNAIQNQLSWFEKFWGNIGRLSLGLGVDDAPIIAQALHEVGNHRGLRTALEGIVGPDPPLVEISTLTTMHGAEPQGIHTDSDYFGSSLLYSRTFLHSYTLFMALQDTTPLMGATTICPGTHWCANPDLSDVCRAPNAFEVSSNGRTGKYVGLLHAGDGMMFNQNIWHRGPKNNDPERPMNRVMFILTFVSRLDMEHADVRQQGVGTFYYQRWNMWGHTWQDLKRASQVMTQPVGALRALGIWKWPSSQWGIVWLEHFARQMANDEDFFASYELINFLNFMDSIRIPRWVQGRSNEESKQQRNQLKWEPFLKQLANHMTKLAIVLHVVVLGVYLVVSLVGIAFFEPKGRRGEALQSTVKRILVMYSATAIIVGALWYHVNYRTYLSQRIHMRDTWRQPFAPVDDLDHLQRTTFPERDDVLVGSRFDAPYLASFGKVLDYHPGNQKLWHAIDHVGTTMPSLLLAHLEPGRFLQQDYKTGYWMLMTYEEKVIHLRHQVYAHHHPLVARLDKHLKQVLADARFGWKRNTIMAQRFIPAICDKWQSVLYEPAHADGARWNTVLTATGSSSRNRRFPTTKTSTPSRLLGLSTQQRVKPLFPKPVSFALRTTQSNLPPILEKDRESRPFVQGDLVQVLEDDRYDEWITATILWIDPFGRAVVEYPETDEIEMVHLDMLRYLDNDTDDANDDDDDNYRPTIMIGTRAMVRFEGKEFFPGRILGVQQDGTFMVQFDDGDYDDGVPQSDIRPIKATSHSYRRST